MISPRGCAKRCEEYTTRDIAASAKGRACQPAMPRKKGGAVPLLSGTAPTEQPRKARIKTRSTNGLCGCHGHHLGRCCHRGGGHCRGRRGAATRCGAALPCPTWRRNAFGRALFAGMDLLDQEMPRIGVLAVSGLTITTPLTAVEKAQAKRLTSTGITHFIGLFSVLLRHAGIVASTTIVPLSTTAALTCAAAGRSRTTAARSTGNDRCSWRGGLGHQRTDSSKNQSHQAEHVPLHFLSPKGIPPVKVFR
jgi:hypothetical protein